MRNRAKMETVVICGVRMRGIYCFSQIPKLALWAFATLIAENTGNGHCLSNVSCKTWYLFAKSVSV